MMNALNKVVFISLFVLILSSCSNLTSLGCPDAEIEWADVLMIDDIHYHHDFPDPSNENLPITIEKGKELGKVMYKMADSACSNHKIRNGDATFLNKGTTIYEVKGYPTSLIVSANDIVFVVNTNDKAKTAGELYPMDNLVKNIYIESTEDGSRIHTFAQSSNDKFLAEFQKLKLEDAMSLDSEGKFEGTRLFLGIELNNGVSFRQAYWMDSNTFMNGAIGNEEIKEVINAELANMKN